MQKKLRNSASPFVHGPSANPFADGRVPTAMAARFVDERAAAAFLGLAVKTLQNWRFYNKGPPFYRFESSIRYAPRDLLAYAQACRVQTTEVAGS